ncbi:MAG: cation:proton antiporter [Deltaproteobacteria bacterium]|nr:cation:proton antiporter [Deltaproteobacteria bacterium]
MNSILLLAIVLVLALVGGRIASFFRLPRVTGYLLTGLLMGPSITGFLTKQEVVHFSFISDIALGIIAFYIGTEFESKKFQRLKKTLPSFFITDVLITFLTVFLAVLVAINGPLVVAVMLGILSMATAPAATLLVIREFDSEGPLTDHIMALVGLNNLVCIIAFVIAMSIISLAPQNPAVGSTVPAAISEVAHGIVVPIVLGLGIALFLHYYLRRGLEENELLLVSLAAILLGVGLSLLFSVSALLTNLTMGGFLINTCDRAKIAVKRLSEVDYPLYALFFAFAGASFHVEMVKEMGLAGGIYILGRTIGKIGGTLLGRKIAGVHIPSGIYLGMGLLPQAGLAIGLSAWAARENPEIGGSLLAMILATTVVFEVAGPILTKLSLVRGGEVKIVKILSTATVGHLKADLLLLRDRVMEALGRAPFCRIGQQEGPILVKHLMRYHIDTIPQDATLDKVIKIMQNSRYTMLPVLGKNNQWIGMLSLRSIRDLSFDRDLTRLIIARDVAENVETLNPDDALAHALRQSEIHQLPYLPVVEKGDQKRFLGVIHRRDICLFQLESDDETESKDPSTH